MSGNIEDFASYADDKQLEKALGNSTRRRILHIVGKKKMFLREIAKDLRIPTSTTAYHLKMLSRAGLVEERKGVYHVFYLPTERGIKLSTGYLK